MVKLVFCVRRRSEYTPEAFRERWLDVHGPLVKKLREQLPQMKRYVQSHALPAAIQEGLRASRGTAEPFDGLTEVWFDSLEAMAGGGTPEELAASQRLHEDEMEFVDFTRSVVFLTEEIDIFGVEPHGASD